ncbi:MAG: hypothetical protein EZS28_004998 [Streblomastix strix]|uniref:Uncharacterized protein n=1 Tax=Streblomastix strix TaxID=222440 RepID=A0A5J4WX60_9EUKA|nr:MAG: hypothetical protein EZS28_004998 [Streblomastix strix]
MKFHQKTQTDIESQQQLALKKVFEEKFEEEEDVSDEIEAQIFSHQNYPISILYDCAETKKWQLNVLKDQSNRKPWEQ